MGALERVMELQSQGMQEPEIIKKMKDEGASPKDINDALNQAKIKQAVSQESQEQPTEGMEQSIMQSPDQTQEPQYAPEQAPQAYDSQQYYQAPQQTLDTDTITEIASQVVAEKFEDFKKKTGDLAAFKFSMQEKLSDIEERVKRLETTIDKIQSAIVAKFSEVSSNTNLVHRDLENLHTTVSGLMNPLMDNYRELRKLAGKE